MTIYNYGSINIDNVYRVPHLVRPGETLASKTYTKVLGGKGSNQSLALSRAGAAVTHIGAINAADEWIAKLLQSSAVNVEYLALLEDTPSGHTVIQVDDNAENCIVLFAGANHEIPHHIVKTALADADTSDWLLVQNECGDSGEIIQQALDKGIKVALNPAPMEASIALLPINDMALLCVNEGEAAQLLEYLGEDTTALSAEELLEHLIDHFSSPEIVLTLGRQGTLYAHGQKRIRQPAFNVKAVDTTGAGDTFVGYYLAAKAAGVDAEKALSMASAASALCVQKEGASSSIPARADVETFLSSPV